MSTIGNWRGPNIIKEGLVLYLDPGSPNSYLNKTSTAIKDISGYGNNGTLTNGPVYNTINGGNLLFDGVNDYVIVNSNVYTKVLNLTIECLFKKVSGRTILSHSSDGAGAIKTYSFEEVDGFNFTAKITTDVTQYTLYGGRLNNSWNLVSTTYDSSLFCLYINGVLTSSTPTSGQLVYQDFNPSLLNIGRKNATDGEYINGNIATVRLYNRALSATEVLQNFNVTKSRFGL